MGEAWALGVLCSHMHQLLSFLPGRFEKENQGNRDLSFKRIVTISYLFCLNF